jgi:hypothetical protein
VNILADQTAQTQCEPWCAAHVPTDTGVLHISRDHVVPLGSSAEAYVSLEQRDGHQAGIRLEGIGDPMSPAQAIQLGQALIASAFAAVSR